jgi:hypothetical protein
MPLILALRRLMRLHNRFTYMMLPSRDEVTVHAVHADDGQEQSADETPGPPKHRLWSRQT